MSRSERINTLLQCLNPSYLHIDNESYQHQVPDGAETHFKVVVVASQFNGLNRIERHRLIYQLLAEELTHGLHALTLHLYTPEQWQTRQQHVPQSPPCLGDLHHG